MLTFLVSIRTNGWIDREYGIGTLLHRREFDSFDELRALRGQRQGRLQMVPELMQRARQSRCANNYSGRVVDQMDA